MLNLKVKHFKLFRSRADQLKVLLNHMHPILQRQALDYGIYIINQVT